MAAQRVLLLKQPMQAAARRTRRRRSGCYLHGSAWQGFRKFITYSIFGIGADRKHTLKWLFPQEKATFHGTEKVYMYSENAPALEEQRQDTRRLLLSQ